MDFRCNNNHQTIGLPYFMNLFSCPWAVHVLIWLHKEASVYDDLSANLAHEWCFGNSRSSYKKHRFGLNKINRKQFVYWNLFILFSFIWKRNFTPAHDATFTIIFIMQHVADPTNTIVSYTHYTHELGILEWSSTNASAHLQPTIAQEMLHHFVGSRDHLLHYNQSPNVSRKCMRTIDTPYNSIAR